MSNTSQTPISFSFEGAHRSAPIRGTPWPSTPRCLTCRTWFPESQNQESCASDFCRLQVNGALFCVSARFPGIANVHLVSSFVDSTHNTDKTQATKQTPIKTRMKQKHLSVRNQSPLQPLFCAVVVLFVTTFVACGVLQAVA